ncbi:MAG: DUF560 domain-containing protein [Rhodobacteraceae bacterium]|nr:DUF560 domain-containing protein [Paracoccaceae bacterium]
MKVSLLATHLSRMVLVPFSLIAGIYFSSVPLAAQNVDRQISQLINTGQLEAARELLNVSNPSEIDRLFFSGRIYKILQQYPQAIAIFREILRRAPNHINAQRELAHTLLFAGEYREAGTRFSDLVRIDPNVSMRNGYRRFLRTIEQNKPAGISAQFSLLPTTNINSGTYNHVFSTGIGDFVIDQSAQGTSGIGVRLGISGFFRKTVSAQNQTQLNWGISGTAYDVEGYGSVAGRLSLAFSHKAPNVQWTVEPFGRYTWNASGSENGAVGLRFAMQKKLSPQDGLAFSTSFEYRTFPGREYQNGPFISVSLSEIHQFGSGLSISSGLRGEFSRPEAAHLQFDSLTLFSDIAKSWENGTNTSLGAQFGVRNFVGVYPLTSSPRADTFSRVSMSISNDRIQVFSIVPKLSCALSSNQSNVAFFDYFVADCQIAFTQLF